MRTVVATLLLSVLVTACTPSAAPVQPAPAPSGEWRQVWDWEGTGDLSDRVFTVDNDQWRLRWTAERHTGKTGSVFNVALYRPGEPRPLRQGASSSQRDEGVISPPVGQGRYQFQVHSRDVDWSVVIEEFSPR